MGDTNIMAIAKELVAQSDAINFLGSSLSLFGKEVVKLNNKATIFGLCLLGLGYMSYSQRKKITKLEAEVKKMKG